MKNILITGVKIFSAAALATAFYGCSVQPPLLSNGERCKPDYYSPTGVLMDCEMQNRKAVIEASREQRRETVKWALKEQRKLNAKYRKENTLNCDETIIFEDGSEACVRED